MVRVIENYKLLFRNYLSGTPMSDINGAMHVSTQLRICEVILSTFDKQKDSLGQMDILGLLRNQKRQNFDMINSSFLSSAFILLSSVLIFYTAAARLEYFNCCTVDSTPVQTNNVRPERYEILKALHNDLSILCRKREVPLSFPINFED